jgi:uncharacterized RDD family membrane protein YckC
MRADSALIVMILLSAAFGLAYFPIFTRISKGLVSPYAKADRRRRLAAATVDGLLCITCVLFYLTLKSPLLLLIGAAYLLLRDSVIIRGQSVGKFLFSLLVVSLETGRPCSRRESARRNFLLLVPGLNLVAVVLETFTIIKDPQGQRLGDRLAQTQVIEGFGARELIKRVQKELLEGPFVTQPGGPVEAPHGSRSPVVWQSKPE